MDGFLKVSTAVTVKIGPFLDSTDGITAETGLTISQADVRLSKNGGNIAQKNEASAATSDELGYYDCALDTTDTNTVGRLLLAVAESGACPVWHTYMVLPAQVYDSLIGGGDALQVHANEITDGLITAAAIATGAIDADAIADNAIDAGAIAADAITAAKIANAAIDANTFAAGAINAAAIATGAVDADALAADAVTEIAAAVWANATRTLSSFGTLAADVWASATRALTDKAGFSLATSEHTSIADALLTRDWTAVTGEAARSVLNALRFLRNKVSISGTTLTVTTEDDATEAWTAEVTTAANADPITAVDPS
jgi:hypothetical protein